MVDSASTELPPTVEETWATPLADNSSASPIATDLNGDGILDIVLGTGTENARGAVEAISGVNGGSLWRNVAANESIFTLPLKLDVNLDGRDEIIVGGRGAELLALDAQTGQQHWSFSLGEIRGETPAISTSTRLRSCLIWMVTPCRSCWSPMVVIQEQNPLRRGRPDT